MNYLEQLDTILDCVCKIGGVSECDVRSRSRVRYLVDLRGVYCLLARELVTDRIATNAAISKRINRDHAECIYLRKRTRDLLDVNDRVVAPLYNEVRDYLNNFEILTEKSLSV